MKYLIIVCTIALSFLLSSCSPHTGTGVWKAMDENDWGIERLVVGFEGRATFVSTKKNNASWHCFWASHTDPDKDLMLSCTASTDVETTKFFALKVNDNGLAELTHETVRLASFKLVDENPSPQKR